MPSKFTLNRTLSLFLYSFLLSLGPEPVSGQHVKVALVALQDDVRRVLPPLNWAGVLSPLMRMPFGAFSDIS